LDRKEAKKNAKKIESIIKTEKEKWGLLKKKQEIKKKKANIGNFDKYFIQEPNQIKIILLGESFSGKTAFIRRFIKDEFISEYITTSAIESFKSELLFFEEDSYKVEFIDTPPLENFIKDLKNYLYFVQGIIVLFDASNKNSFLRMKEYFNKINFYNFQRIGIIATKKDICKENKKYKYHQLKNFCRENNAIPYFISVKNSKKDIYNFINLLCPKIIPSLVNKKKEIKLEYPFTKNIKNDFPKENYLDKAILQKLKDDDSSYESEKEEDANNIKNRDEIIKEYLIKKEMEKNQIIKKKINTIFSVGKINGKIHENDEEYNNQSFNDVIAKVNLDMIKLFKKYRPDSDYKSNKNEKNNKENKNPKDNEEWSKNNLDEMVDKFMKTKDEFNIVNNEKEISKEEDNISEKNDNKDNSININNNGKEKDNINENVKNENEKEKIENEEEEEKDKEENKKIEEEKKEKSEDEKVEEEKEEYDDNNKNEKEDLEDDNYEDLSNDIYEFKKSLISEARRQHEI
jgi:signal recognition particle receptor subunit beta